MDMSARNLVSIWRRHLVRRDIKSIESRDFSILSSNCVGGRVYDVLGLPYLTPTVGLFFFPDCFLKFASNPQMYLQRPLKEAKHSLYVNRPTYPIALIDDVEVHFLHYGSFSDAFDKWKRRVDRVNFNRLYVSMTDRDGFGDRHEVLFERLPIEAKVLFSCKPRFPKDTVVIPGRTDSQQVSDLYTNYDAFYGNFSFSRWINSAS